MGVVKRAGPWIGGMVDHFMGSRMFLTFSSLLIEEAGEGAYKFNGLATMLGAAVAKKKGIGIEELGRGVSVPY